MEVSRIDAISPKQIDWRKLTAKEIIKYDNQGVEVPTQYLQWAKEFRNDVESASKDETTYEMANLSQIQTNPETSEDSTTTLTSTDTSQIPVETAGSDENSTTQEPVVFAAQNKTAAQQKRDTLTEAGVSLRTQAKIFTGDSKEATKASIAAVVEEMLSQAKSEDEIQNLDNVMSAILAKAEATQNEFKAEVDKINNSENDARTFSKMGQLEDQLKRYGTQAQSLVSVSEAEFMNLDSVMNAQTSAIITGQDFGAETVNVGNELLATTRGEPFLARIIDTIIGRRAVKAGEKSVENADNAEKAQSEALSVNSSNMSDANAYRAEIESKTGVAGESIAKHSDEQNSSEKGKDSEKTGAQAQDKAIENPTNDQTEKAASANLDKVLQAKIKKGEVLEA